MKLPNQTRGPVELRDIDYSPKLSQETFAFAAVVYVRPADGGALGGHYAAIRNSGTGGAHLWDHIGARIAAEAYAATLPPIQSHGMTLQLDGDALISEMVAAAILQRDDKRRARAGFTYRAELADGRSAYLKADPDGDNSAPAILRRSFGDALALTAKLVELRP